MMSVPVRSTTSAFHESLLCEFGGSAGGSLSLHTQRCNAFGREYYHASRVEDGEYLWDCFCRVEWNTVRCGVVAHPRDWEWAGFHEVMGAWWRYRLIDEGRLCWRLRARSTEAVWCLREAAAPYGQKAGTEIASKGSGARIF